MSAATCSLPVATRNGGESVPALKSKVQQAIEESTNRLVALLEAGQSEALTQYLGVMAKFHNYSFGNQMAIARQKPDATHVAGFHKWLEFHRFVKKGEKGIAILAPMIVKHDRTPREENADPAPHLVGFRVVYVFDVSQTDGEPLEEYDAEASGEPGELLALLKTRIEEKGIPVTYDATIAPARGLCTPTDIKLLPDMSAAQEFAVLCHEYGHALLHQGTRRNQTSKTVRETEAEAVSFIVSSAIGLDCGQSASDYISMYDGNKQTLVESLQHVQGAASEILAALTL